MQIDSYITYRNPAFLPWCFPPLSRCVAEESCSCRIPDSAKISSLWPKTFEGSTLLASECTRILESACHCKSQPLSQAPRVALAPPKVCFCRFEPERRPSSWAICWSGKLNNKIVTCIVSQLARKKIDGQIQYFSIFVRGVESGFIFNWVVVEEGFLWLGVVLEAFNWAVQIASYIADSKQPQFPFVGKMIDILVLDVFRESRFPIYAVEKSWYFRQKLGAKIAFILPRICVEIFPVIFGTRIQRLHAIFSIDADQVYGFSVFGVIFCSPDLFKFTWSDFGDWEILDNFDTSLGGSSSSCNGKDHGRQLFGNLFLLDFLSNLLEVGVTVLNVKIFVCTVTMEEGCTDSLKHDVLTKTLEEVDGSCYPSIFAKSYQPIIVFICDFFIID